MPPATSVTCCCNSFQQPFQQHLLHGCKVDAL
jgi:hypothetical protein